MIKQVGKSALWGILYITCSSFGATVAILYYILTNLDMFQLNSDVFFEHFFSVILRSTVPATFISSILCIIAYLVYRKAIHAPSELKSVTFSQAVFCFALGAVFNLLVSYVLEFFWGLFPEDWIESATTATALLDTDFHWLFLLLSVGIATPMAEEVIFRHGFCRTLSKGNVSLSIILSALIFGIAHGNWIQGTYTFILGLMCAIVLLNTDNLWYPILIHMGLNVTTVISNAVPESFGELTLIVCGFVGLLICSTMLIHKEDMRAMLAKPDMVPALEKETLSMADIPLEDLEQRVE